MSDVDDKLSTSRIHRLLRPLRNRCISLASFATGVCRSGIRTTYVSQTSGDDIDGSLFPPLSVLQPPMDMSARIHFDKHRIDSLEMSRKVYAVRDCFHDIVSKTGKHRAGTAAMTGTQQFAMSLAAICSIVVGKNMQCGAEENSDDIEDANLVNDIYEAIPLQYRRFALLSHAINLVLNTTVHHPTLLSILLDVTLAYGLLYESSTVLRALLFVALSPVSAGARPPVCHSVHSIFLLELHTRWTGRGFPEQPFCRILIEVLHVVRSPEAWGSKAVHKLARDICSSNFVSFMELAGGCTSTALKLDSSDRRKIRATKPKKQDNSCVAMLLWARLREWLDIVCDHCITAENSGESSSETSDAVYAFLELSLSSGLHHNVCTVEDADIPHVDLQGAIVCLATYCLLSFFIPNLRADSIANRLREITPRSSTFATLITKTFATLSLDRGQSKLQSIAVILRLHDLPLLEASMWACALRQTELSTPKSLFGSGNGITEIRQYRDRLIDLVDEAEHRCFGVDALLPDPRHKPSGYAKGDALGSTTSHLNCKWEWEAMLRCWVHTGHDHPSVKRRKVEPAKMLSLSSSRSLRSRTASITVQNASRTVRTTRNGHMEGIAEGSVRQRSFQSGGESITHTSQDMQLPLQPSSSNFASLLADAFSRRTVVRDKHTQPEAESRLSIQPKCSSSSSLSHNSEHQVITLPSDDLLDLFICQAPHEEN